MSEILTLDQAAELLRCHRSTLYRMAKKREIPAFRLGGGWRFEAERLKDWIAKQYEGSDANGKS